MKNQPVTISALARNLGLSTCTVSRVLNKAFKGFTYAPETIRRVEEEAARLGYRPNPQARALRTKRTGLVGFILPSARVSVFGELTDRLEYELRTRGYHLLISHSRESADEETYVMQAFLSQGVEGMLWIPLRARVKLESRDVPAHFPMVILDRPSCCPGVSHVTTDNRAAGRMLASRIGEAGHRHVAVINAPRGDRSMKERCEGFRDVFGTDLQVCVVDNDIEQGRAAGQKLCDKNRRSFTALVALAEPLAIGALAALRDCEVRVPEDLSFASFDDFVLAGHWTPRITALRQDVAEIARRAVEILTERFKTPGLDPEHIRIPVQMHWRDSIAVRN